MVRNQVTLIGNVGQDPKLETTGNGTTYCRFSVAVNERYKKDGETQTITKWFPLTLWGKQAEVLSKIIRKGSQVAVQGSLNSRTQEIDGKKYTLVDIRVNEIEVLGSKGGSRSESEDSSSGMDDMDSIDSDDIDS